MKNYAPDIYRQRLIVEGIYSSDKIREDELNEFLVSLSYELKMHIIYGPKVMDIAGSFNPKHSGIEGIMIWSESGVQCYTWESKKFFSCDIYSCKKFSVKKTVDFIKDFFMTKKLVWKSI